MRLLTLIFTLSIFTANAMDYKTKSILWSYKAQNPDGSWGTKNKRILSSLMLLKSLGAGETHTSATYGKSIKMAMEYLVKEGQTIIKSQKADLDGALVLWALSESYSMTGISLLEPPIKGLEKILISEFKDNHWPTKEHEVEANLFSMEALKAVYSSGVSTTDIEPIYKKLDKWFAAQKETKALLARGHLNKLMG